jgi:hypothetical protein
MLLEPRNTIRWILTYDPNYGVSMIAILAGITAALRTSVLHGLHPAPNLMGITPLLDEVIAFGIGPSAGVLLSVITLALFGSLLGILMIWVGALSLLFVGWIFGGQGRYNAVRAALAWAFVPYSWLLPLWLLYAILNLSELRSGSFSYAAVMPWEVSGWLAALMWLDYAVRILAFVWLVLKLSVALRISVRRSIIVSALVLLPPIILLAPWQYLGF